MDERILELFEGITLHFINTKRFKTDFVAAFLFADLNREDVTKNALIPAVLTRGTEKMPTMKDISVYLEESYGSVLDASSDKIGDKQALQFYITAINGKYTFENEDLLSKNIDLLCDVMLHPKLENGVFDAEYVKQEKETLRELIKSRINNKGAYANSRCIEEMCKDEPYGLYKFGYEEDLDAISSENLYAQYEKLLKTSEMHIYISGDIDEEKVLQQFKRHFENVERHYDAAAQSAGASNSHELKTVIEEQDVTQGKLVLGLRARESTLLDDMYPLIVYNAILGGTPSSKLFQNVREKASLAYTTRSSYLKHKNIVLVSSGIEIANYEKALELIQKQLEDMREGNFTEEDVSDAKIALENAYRSYLDEQTAIINLYMGQQLLGNVEPIPEMIQNIERVTKEEIVRVAEKLELEIIYFLKNK
ncbi:MAG: insulinase family protein [Clostridia bacterium]|nr:insulinase family protein [Clostridia bacterium]